MMILTAIKRTFHMGIFKNLSKIETLIEANVPGSWQIYHNCLKVKHLPEDWQKAMIQFGYTKEAPIFGVEWYDEEDKQNNLLAVISFGADQGGDCKDFRDLLYRDVDRDWRMRWSMDEMKGSIENFQKAIDICYVRLQQYFMFMKIYLKQREQMVKQINIEYDEIIESTKDA